MAMTATWLLNSGFVKFETSTQDAQVIAKVGTATLTVADFKDRITTIPPQFMGVLSTYEGKKRLLDQAVEEMLLYQYAKDGDWMKKPDVQQSINKALQQIVVSLYIQTQVADQLTISEAELKDHYQANPTAYTQPERYKARHILVKDLDIAKEVYSRLKVGGDFEALSQKYSIGPTSLKGGDLGWFEAGQMVPDFENACRKLKPGEVSIPVKTQYGWHIIKLEDYKAANIKPFDEVHDEIRDTLLQLKQEKTVNRLINTIKEKTPVETKPDLLNAVKPLTE